MTTRASSRRDAIVLAATVAWLGVVYAIFARVAMHGFPFSGDEYSYFLQAEIFARGLLHAPSPPHPELLRVDHVILAPWVCSKYPPGTSALLAIGVRLGAPWLVTPIEGVVTLVAMAFAARRLLGSREAIVAVALLGTAPLFAFQAASFFSHTATTMWLTIAFAAVLSWSERAASWKMLVAGAALGCAFVTRPLDAALFAVALLSLRSVRAVVLVALGAAPFAAGVLVYQAAQYGSPWADGYAAYQPTFEAIYGAHAAASPLAFGNLVDPEQFWHHLDILRAMAIDWTVPGTVLLAMLGWGALRDVGPALAGRRLASALIFIFCVTLFFTIGGSDDGARPRYLSTVLIPLAWLGAKGWTAARELLEERLERWVVRVIGVAVWVVPLIMLIGFIVSRTPALRLREGLFNAVAKNHAEGVVVVRTEFPTRFARNGPFFDGPVLYVSAPAGMTLAEISAAFPGRAVQEAHEALDRESWSMSPPQVPGQAL